MYQYNPGMMNYPIGFNPYNQPLQTRDIMPQQIVRVNGIEGAKAYQLAPNSMAALFHESEDIFFIKSTDGAGFPTIKSYKFTPVEMETSPASADYATKEELDALRKELVSYAQQFIQQPKSATNERKKPGSDPEI